MNYQTAIIIHVGVIVYRQCYLISDGISHITHTGPYQSHFQESPILP